ncbi:MAG: hypothetical protein U5K69_16755 [Balneolaceae bacterium]|nr:hypothetical protein [Balneolaceae bacterium]
MKNTRHTASAALAVLLLVIIGCSKSDDQKEFENQAYSPPEGYTAMSANAQELDQSDPDDWRISPMYQGLLSIVSKAYPNPVFINSTSRIQLNINYITNLSRIEAWVFQTSFQEDGRGPVDSISDSQISEGGVPVINLNPSSFPQNFRGDNLYRILILDQSGNVITYGDIKVEQ